MTGFLSSKQVGWAVAGFVGLLVGGLVPDSPLHAVATDRQDNFAMATGMIEGGIEAVFTLDFLTGELRAAVLNPNTRSFTSFYEYNVTNDLKVEQGKQPRYLLVTGQAALRLNSQMQMGGSVVYVAELSSGMMGVYGVPYSPASIIRPVVNQQNLVLLQAVPFRSAPVRGQ
jgi:hypothetical protein